MFTLKIQNANGEIFELTHNSKNFYVTGIEGLALSPVTINTASSGLNDGSFFNSAIVEQRNIIIYITINGDIEQNRQRLYRVFSTKTPCTIYFKNKNRNVKIIGYVEAFECDLFSQRQAAQISIICPRPYFESLETVYTELSKIVKLFEFPFSISEPTVISEIADTPLCQIINDGDIETGFIITMNIQKTISSLTLYNTTKQESFGVNYSFLAGDQLTINTKAGEKSVTLLREGQETNMLNYISKNSTWLTLGVGLNEFTFTVNTGEEATTAVFETTSLYGGV